MTAVSFTPLAEARALAAPGQGGALSGRSVSEGSAPESSTFETLLDIINPLQHLPVVSSLYRAVTGDKISTSARLIGDTLFAGPIGLVSAAVNVAVAHETGKDVGQHLLDAALFLQENREA
jgi:hypothetical protein